MKKIVLPLLASVTFSLGQDDAIVKNTQVDLTIRGVPTDEIQGFNGSYTVYSNGTINIPHIGAVQAVGKTPSQLARQIEGLYKNAEFYSNPTVNVAYEFIIDREVEEEQEVITFRSQQTSRIVPHIENMTLQQAIAAAGGAGTFDSKKFATLERNGKEYNYDMNNIDHRNVKIYPNDVIKLPHVNKDSKITSWLEKLR